VHRQGITAMRVTQHDIQHAYRDLVVRESLRDLIGAAMNSHRPMFFYGPAGSGKTFLAESLLRLIRGTIHVPYALIVDGEIIQVFDPMIHRRVDAEKPKGSLDNRTRGDERWVACHRPVAISGGELTIDMLNLQYDHVAGYYQAPAHVKANNGLYIVDDLGRQQIKPEQLMNRWIVPMDRRRDYLTLHTGGSFEIPFDVRLVFSTNLAPKAIADEAFLRRLGYKIYVGPVSESEYERIFRQVCVEFDVEFHAGTFEALLNMHRRLSKPTFACYPRDLIAQVRDYATYREWPVDLTPQLIEWAWHSYFATQ
jgi:predicted ATPase with chaperone activity